jgi:hypothetical protein
MGFGFTSVVHEVIGPNTSPWLQWFMSFGPLRPPFCQHEPTLGRQEGRSFDEEDI